MILYFALLTLLLQGPPTDAKATRTPDLVELVKLDPTIRLDIRYAGSNNFVGQPVYKDARAFLQRPAAAGLVAAHRELARQWAPTQVASWKRRLPEPRAVSCR